MYEKEGRPFGGGIKFESEMDVDESDSSVVVCWRRFRQWVHCFCVVTFDLELGQTLEVVYPGDAPLSSQERSDLCYLAFPDSNSTTQPANNGGFGWGRLNKSGPSDSVHHFRIRRSQEEGNDGATSTPTLEMEEELPSPLRPDARFFHGFTYFRRQRDPDLPRGYFQKSIVMVSPLPFVALFQQVLAKVALAFFTSGESAIETACLQIDRHWPEPIAGKLISLPLFGLRFQCTIPAIANGTMPEAQLYQIEHLDLANGTNLRAKNFFSDVPGGQNQKCFSKEEDGFEFVEYSNESIVLLESVHETDQHFHVGIKRLLPHLQLLWELILLGEPLLVLAPNPSLSSNLVHALVSLISPLRYYGDHRPFFTIHDSDFTDFSGRQNCCVNNFVLGVTNPFFLKAFAHWPHILRLGSPVAQNNHLHRQRSSESRLFQLRNPPSSVAAQIVLAGIRRSGTALKEFNGLRRSIGENGAPGEDTIAEAEEQRTIKRLSDRAQLDHRTSGGLLSAHRQFLCQDKSLVRKLLRTPSDSASQWNTLRRHFNELTHSFINPLERYIASLLPLRRHLCPFQPVPPMKPFSLEHFLLSLRHFGHPGVKGDWQGLYRQFVARSPNFIGWLQQRRRQIERQLRTEHLTLLCRVDLSPEVLAQRDQVEIVDLVLKLRDRLSELDNCQQRRRAVTQLAVGGRMRGQSSSPIKAAPSSFPDVTSSPSSSRAADRQRLQLQHQLNKLLASVDAELQHVLLSNSALRRAAVVLDQK